MDDGISSGYEAIGWALRRVSIPIIDGSSVWEMGRKEGYREFMPGLNPWEKVAESALILHNVDRACRGGERAAVMTYFTGGTVRETAMLIHYVSKTLGRDRWVVKDIVLLWAKGFKGHTQEWWARKYGVSQQAISRWGLKIRQLLDDLFSLGLSRCEDALALSGHVGSE